MTNSEFTGPGVLTPGGPARVLQERSVYDHEVVDVQLQDGSRRTFDRDKVIFPVEITPVKKAA